jgi:mRNA-degrading endonuclease RelE of RelBE toxin-antitoxin system
MAIRDDFMMLAQDPFSRAVDVRKLEPKGKGIYRLRVRNWRAIFELDKRGKYIRVLRIDDRRDAY